MNAKSLIAPYRKRAKRALRKLVRAKMMIAPEGPRAFGHAFDRALRQYDRACVASARKVLDDEREACARTALPLYR